MSADEEMLFGAVQRGGQVLYVAAPTMRAVTDTMKSIEAGIPELNMEVYVDGEVQPQRITAIDRAKSVVCLDHQTGAVAWDRCSYWKPRPDFQPVVAVKEVAE